MKFEKLELKEQSCFELKDIFECGQCFRWHKEPNGSYSGVVSIGVLNVSKEDKNVTIKGYIDDKSSLKVFCHEYFNLGCDYESIQKTISKNDEEMKRAIKFGKGIRILNQDKFEMLISYIISAANNIPRISKCINNISKEYGEKVLIPKEIAKDMFEADSEEKRVYYLFPSPKKLSKATQDALRQCNLGFRDKYVLENAIKVASGELNLDKIKKLDYKTAKKELTKLSGVGDKVADCILLFSMNKTEAFPVDTWIKKIMNEVYVDSLNVKKINEYAYNKWGENAGIAQQYLFYYKRENS